MSKSDEVEEAILNISDGGNVMDVGGGEDSGGSRDVDELIEAVGGVPVMTLPHSSADLCISDVDELSNLFYTYEICRVFHRELRLTTFSIDSYALAICNAGIPTIFHHTVYCLLSACLRDDHKQNVWLGNHDTRDSVHTLFYFNDEVLYPHLVREYIGSSRVKDERTEQLVEEIRASSFPHCSVRLRLETIRLLADIFLDSEMARERISISCGELTAFSGSESVVLCRSCMTRSPLTTIQCNGCMANYHLECCSSSSSSFKAVHWLCRVCYNNTLYFDYFTNEHKATALLGYDRHRRAYRITGRRLIIEHTKFTPPAITSTSPKILYFSTPDQVERLFEIGLDSRYEAKLMNQIRKRSDSIDVKTRIDSTYVNVYATEAELAVGRKELLAEETLRNKGISFKLEQHVFHWPQQLDIGRGETLMPSFSIAIEQLIDKIHPAFLHPFWHLHKPQWLRGLRSCMRPNEFAFALALAVGSIRDVAFKKIWLESCGFSSFTKLPVGSRDSIRSRSTLAKMRECCGYEYIVKFQRMTLYQRGQVIANSDASEDYRFFGSGGWVWRRNGRAKRRVRPRYAPLVSLAKCVEGRWQSIVEEDFGAILTDLSAEDRKFLDPPPPSTLVLPIHNFIQQREQQVSQSIQHSLSLRQQMQVTLVPQCYSPYCAGVGGQASQSCYSPLCSLLPDNRPNFDSYYAALPHLPLDSAAQPVNLCGQKPAPSNTKRTALPLRNFRGKRSRKPSVFNVSDLNKLARRAGNYECVDFIYSLKTFDSDWYRFGGVPRPSFRHMWFYKLLIKQPDSFALLTALRQIFGLINWSSMAAPVPNDSRIHTVIQEQYCVTREILKRRELSDSMHAMFLVKTTSTPLSGYSGPQQASKSQRLSAKAAAMPTLKVDECWIKEEELELWEIREFYDTNPRTIKVFKNMSQIQEYASSRPSPVVQQPPPRVPLAAVAPQPRVRREVMPPPPPVAPLMEQQMQQIQVMKSADGKMQVLGLLPGQELKILPTGEMELVQTTPLESAAVQIEETSLPTPQQKPAAGGFQKGPTVVKSQIPGVAFELPHSSTRSSATPQSYHQAAQQISPSLRGASTPGLRPPTLPTSNMRIPPNASPLSTLIQGSVVVDEDYSMIGGDVAAPPVAIEEVVVADHSMLSPQPLETTMVTVADAAADCYHDSDSDDGYTQSLRQIFQPISNRKFAYSRLRIPREQFENLEVVQSRFREQIVARQYLRRKMLHEETAMARADAMKRSMPVDDEAEDVVSPRKSTRSPRGGGFEAPPVLKYHHRYDESEEEDDVDDLFIGSDEGDEVGMPTDSEDEEVVRMAASSSEAEEEMPSTSAAAVKKAIATQKKKKAAAVKAEPVKRKKEPVPVKAVAAKKAKKGGKKAEELYCICKTPYDDKKFYIGCDECKNWFHGKCVGISESKARGMSDFLCDDCKANQPLYCLCQTPYDERRFYIGCDSCHDWFHGDCVSVSEKDSKAIESFICAKCKGRGIDSSKRLRVAQYRTLAGILDEFRKQPKAGIFVKPTAALRRSLPVTLPQIEDKIASRDYRTISDVYGDFNDMFEHVKKAAPNARQQVESMRSFLAKQIDFLKQSY